MWKKCFCLLFVLVSFFFFKEILEQDHFYRKCNVITSFFELDIFAFHLWWWLAIISKVSRGWAWGFGLLLWNHTHRFECVPFGNKCNAFRWSRFRFSHYFWDLSQKLPRATVRKGVFIIFIFYMVLFSNDNNQDTHLTHLTHNFEKKSASNAMQMKHCKKEVKKGRREEAIDAIFHMTE